MQLPYGVDDDQAAIEAVGSEINRPNTARWRAMTADDDRLRQTYRALGQLIKQVEVAFLRRKADLRAFQGTPQEHQQASADYEEWKSRTVHFVNCARQRRGELEPRIHQADGDRRVQELTTALRSMARAVADHRDAIRRGERGETTADRLLWVRLDLVPEKWFATTDDEAADTETEGVNR
jgi:hypothetical protein